MDLTVAGSAVPARDLTDALPETQSDASARALSRHGLGRQRDDGEGRLNARMRGPRCVLHARLDAPARRF